MTQKIIFAFSYCSVCETYIHSFLQKWITLCRLLQPVLFLFDNNEHLLLLSMTDCIMIALSSDETSCCFLYRKRYVSQWLVPLGRGPWEVILLLGKVGLEVFPKCYKGGIPPGSYSTKPFRMGGGAVTPLLCSPGTGSRNGCSLEMCKGDQYLMLSLYCCRFGPWLQLAP